MDVIVPESVVARVVSDQIVGSPLSSLVLGSSGVGSLLLAAAVGVFVKVPEPPVEIMGVSVTSPDALDNDSVPDSWVPVSLCVVPGTVVMKVIVTVTSEVSTSVENAESVEELGSLLDAESAAEVVRVPSSDSDGPGVVPEGSMVLKGPVNSVVLCSAELL